MPKKLRKLRIDEISSVDRGAGEGCKVMLWKRDNTQRDDDDAKQRDEDSTGSNDNKLSGKLKEMVRALIISLPSLSESQAMHFLIHTTAGRATATHLAQLSKREERKTE